MTIRVLHKPNARRIIARNKPDGSITLTVPSWMPQSQWQPIAEDLIKRIQADATPRWTQRFSDQQQIECGDYTISITSSPRQTQTVTASRCGKIIEIHKGAGLVWGEQSTDLLINRVLTRISAALAPSILIPEAMELAATHGVSVSAWKIGRGHHTLGNCRSDGRITLSAINIFLPRHLRDYIVCHELAHRSEMNHSKRFHFICNRYLCGQETKLSAELKQFKWPIIR